MEICSEIIGNLHDPEWREKIGELKIDYIPLDQWTAQKSRFLAKGESGTEYPIALKRQTQVVDGDIVYYDPEKGEAAALRLELNPVLALDLSALAGDDPENIIRRSLELGHAIGNQHWPAVVKGTKIYVPLTVDKQVMLSVMDTHHLEGITYEFQPGREVIPYMAPHEIRRLFGGASHGSHAHTHPHDHDHH
ncbi:MAG: urease accessory protein UreE [Desulfovibrio sp.]|nr:urease accessory protein UreE [Desulfovibrio sp.]